MLANTDSDLEGVDDCLNVRLDSFMREFGAGQRAHALQRQIPQVGLTMLKELPKLVTRPHQQVGFTVGQKPPQSTGVNLQAGHGGKGHTTWSQDRLRCPPFYHFKNHLLFRWLLFSLLGVTPPILALLASSHEWLAGRTQPSGHRLASRKGAPSSKASCSPVIVDDEADGFKKDGILGVGMLDLLGLGRLLGLVEDGLQALDQAAFHGCIFCGESGGKGQRTRGRACCSFTQPFVSPPAPASAVAPDILRREPAELVNKRL